MDEKFCPRCEETKPYNEFYNHKKAKDGLDSKCKICSKEIRNENRNKHRFNRDFYDSHCKPWDEEDTIYLAEYWVHEEDKIGFALALGRTYTACQQRYYNLKSSNLLEKYKTIGKGIA